MRLKYRYMLREVSGQWVAVAVGKDHADFNGMITLNAPGAFLLERLTQGEQSREDLLSALLDRYNVTPERAEEDLDRFLQVLRDGNILVE